MNLASLKHSMSIKNHNDVANCDFTIPSLSVCWKTYIQSNFSWFFFQLLVLQVSFISAFLLINPFNFLQFYWLLFLILRFSDKLCIRAESPFLFALRTVCLMLPKLQYAIFQISTMICLLFSHQIFYIQVTLTNSGTKIIMRLNYRPGKCLTGRNVPQILHFTKNFPKTEKGNLFFWMW